MSDFRTVNCESSQDCRIAFITAGVFVDGEELESGSQAELLPGKTNFRLGSCAWTFSLEKNFPAERPESSGRDGREPLFTYPPGVYSPAGSPRGEGMPGSGGPGDVEATLSKHRGGSPKIGAKV
jgi:hypothetical protein